MFISVDVETGNTQVIPGALLTIGAVAITEDLQVVDKFYIHLAYDEKSFDEKTINWWNDETEEDLQVEAFSWVCSRVVPFSAAVMFADWVNNLKGEGEAYFVANPATFDHAWISQLFAATGVETPFSHRTVCLRSMRFGITGGKWGGSRSDDDLFPMLDPTPNEKPHHALYDAEAQGYDFINMMKYLQAR